MNYESLMTGIIFWASFSFSPGPFWITWMNLHAHTNNFWAPYKSYIPYLFLGFTTHSFVLSLLVKFFGKINEMFILPLYFIGGAYILFLAWQTVFTTKKKLHVRFDFKHMLLLSLSNPKVYLTIPSGALSANYFPDQIVLNAIIFSTVLLIPITLSGSILFAVLGKFSQKIAMKQIAYFSSFLLVLYGGYLLFEGVVKIFNLVNASQ